MVFTIFMVNRRFGFYAWMLDNGIIKDSRQEYAEWLKKELPSFKLDQTEAYMELIEKKADDYLWLGIYNEETGEYIDCFFPKVLENRFWASWSWSDTDIAAQTMERPVDFEVELQDSTVRVRLMSYQSLKFFPGFYAGIVIVDSGMILMPILLFVRRRMKYLGRVGLEAAAMGEGDMEHPVTIKGKDEIAALAAELDSLRIALKTSMENERQVHLDNRELIRALSHDLRTPLTTLNGYLEILSRKKGNEEDYSRYVRKCLEKGEEIRGMTDKMFEYALVFENPGETAMQDYSAGELLAEIREQAEYLSLQGMAVAFLPEKMEEKQWKANPFLMRRLVSNLCSNILRYGDREKPVKIRVYIEEKTFTAVFANEISGQRQAEGSGVGLKSAARIAELHGGCLLWEEREGKFQAKMCIPV